MYEILYGSYSSAVVMVMNCKYVCMYFMYVCMYACMYVRTYVCTCMLGLEHPYHVSTVYMYT